MSRSIDAIFYYTSGADVKEKMLMSRPLRINVNNNFVGVIKGGKFFYINSENKVFSSQIGIEKSDETPLIKAGNNVTYYDTEERKLIEEIYSEWIQKEKDVQLENKTIFGKIIGLLKTNKKTQITASSNEQDITDIYFGTRIPLTEKYVEEYSSLCIDLGVFLPALHTYINKDKLSEQIYQKAISRFSKLSTFKPEDIPCSESLLNNIITSASNSLLPMQFSFFIFPFGSTKLLKALGKNYDSSSILNVLAKPYFKYKSKKYKNLLWADKQIFFSVLFHSLIYKEYFIGRIHRSHLTYIFNKNLTIDEVQTKLLSGRQISPIFEKDFSENTCLKIALERITEEAIFSIKRWPAKFSTKIYNYLAELPLRFRISKEIIPINDINYPIQIKRLSVYILLNGKFTNDEKLKIKTLHTVGLRNIGNLLVLTPNYNLMMNP